MFTTAVGLGGRAKTKRHVPTKATRASALLGALILVSIAINGLIIVAYRVDRLFRQSAPTLMEIICEAQ
jgi:hypothetical protein